MHTVYLEFIYVRIVLLVPIRYSYLLSRCFSFTAAGRTVTDSLYGPVYGHSYNSDKDDIYDDISHFVPLKALKNMQAPNND